MAEFLITLAVIFALVLLSVLWLLSLKGTLTVAYRKELTVSFRVLCFKIMLYPLPPKKKHKKRRMSVRAARRIRKQKQRQEKLKSLIRQKLFGGKSSEPKKEPRATSENAEARELEKPPIGKTVSFVVDIIAAFTEAVAIIVKRFTHHLRIKVARLHVKIASEDAALTAVAYGSVSQIINVLLPILSTVKNFKLPRERDFDISVDFSTTTAEVDAEVSFSLRVWHLADVGIRSLIGGFVKFARRNDSLDDLLSWLLRNIFAKPDKEKEASPQAENN